MSTILEDIRSFNDHIGESYSDLLASHNKAKVDREFELSRSKRSKKRGRKSTPKEKQLNDHPQPYHGSWKSSQVVRYGGIDSDVRNDDHRVKEDVKKELDRSQEFWRGPMGPVNDRGVSARLGPVEMDLFDLPIRVIFRRTVKDDTSEYDFVRRPNRRRVLALNDEFLADEFLPETAGPSRSAADNNVDQDEWEHLSAFDDSTSTSNDDEKTNLQFSSDSAPRVLAPFSFLRRSGS